MTTPSTVIRPVRPEELRGRGRDLRAIPSAVADWQQKLGDLAVRGLPFLAAERSDDVAGPRLGR
ncbi:hypothetical protein [Nonomuraea sp. NPDC049695]|uniref:hypothetical protein n=1 Tax=Nonomuraea sp. NPDC049695 TaxID=3154734 RepID=UPI0034403D16